MCVSWEVQLSLSNFTLTFCRQGKPEDKENGNRTNTNKMKEVYMNIVSQV